MAARPEAEGHGRWSWGAGAPVCRPRRCRHPARMALTWFQSRPETDAGSGFRKGQTCAWIIRARDHGRDLLERIAPMCGLTDGPGPPAGTLRAAECAGGRRRKGDVAGATGLEPAASGVTGRRSNQLSYAPLKASPHLGSRPKPVKGSAHIRPDGASGARRAVAPDTPRSSLCPPSPGVVGGGVRVPPFSPIVGRQPPHGLAGSSGCSRCVLWDYPQPGTAGNVDDDPTRARVAASFPGGYWAGFDVPTRARAAPRAVP